MLGSVLASVGPSERSDRRDDQVLRALGTGRLQLGVAVALGEAIVGIAAVAASAVAATAVVQVCLRVDDEQLTTHTPLLIATGVAVAVVAVLSVASGIGRGRGRPRR